MSIRRAEERDTEDILRLLVQVNLVHHDGRPDLFNGPATKYTREELLSIFRDEDRPVFVLTDAEDAHVLGYAFCILQTHPQDPILTPIVTLYIDDICVDEAFRGQHIATKLYRHTIAYAKERGCHNVTLNVWECNETAKKFYEAMGMSVQKTTMEQLL